MDRRSFIIPQNLDFTTACKEDQCVCEDENIVVNKAQYDIRFFHLLFISMLSFGSAFVYVMFENNNSNTAWLRQTKANAIACPVQKTNDIASAQHSTPSDSNSNCPHYLLSGFLYKPDSKRKKINHC